MSKQLNLFLEHSKNQLPSARKSTYNSTSISTEKKNIKDVENLGQVFTPTNIAKFMASLIKNNGSILEPSCGDGVFLKEIDGSVTAIEIDPNQVPDGAINMDFFDLSIEKQFDTIIGNPPYVRFQDIPDSTKIKLESDLFDKRTNLYLFFIEKCINHLKPSGELIFIVPREFLKSTSSVRMNNWLFSKGTLTNVVDFGDSKIFEGAVPNTIVFRFEKDNFSRECKIANLRTNRTDEIAAILKWKKTNLNILEGHFYFSENHHVMSLKQIAEVKVGAVSGMDSIYTSEIFGNRFFVNSATVRDGSLRKMYWPEDENDAKMKLGEFKDQLMNRGIRKFSENDWWVWGRGYPLNNKPRIYVNGKTRNPRPFFLNDCPNFDGSVLAIFPRNPKVNLEDFAEALNQLDWESLGFLCDGRFIFSQRSLENCPLPKYFKKFI